MGLIAIYERDDLMRELLREWLTAAGYAVREAWDCNRSVPDLAIVSVEAPKSESGGVIRALQREWPEVPVIGLSSRARSGLCSNGAAARALGVKRLLAKPIKRLELLMAVAEAVVREDSA